MFLGCQECTCLHCWHQPHHRPVHEGDMYMKVRRSCLRSRAQEPYESQGGCPLHNSYGLWRRKAKVNSLACTASGDAAGGGGPSRCQVFWTCSPWYEACSVPLNSLHLVDVCPSQSCVSVLLYVNTDRTDRKGRGAEDVHLTFHVAPEI